MADKRIDDWKKQFPQKALADLATNIGTTAPANATARNAAWIKVVTNDDFAKHYAVLFTVQTMLYDMAIADSTVIRAPFTKNGVQATTDDDLAAYVGMTIAASFDDVQMNTNFDEAEMNTNLTNLTNDQANERFIEFINRFLGAWFVLYRADQYITPDGTTPTSEYKFEINYKGQVTVTDKNGKAVDLYVNSEPDGSHIRKCAVNNACSSIMFIMSSANRTNNIAEKALYDINNDYVYIDKNVQAVVAAFAIMRRLHWRGINKDGKKQLINVEDLSEDERKRPGFRADLALMYTGSGASAAGIMSGITLPAGAATGAQINDVNLDYPDNVWKAAVNDGAFFVPTAVGRLVLRCIEIVNANPTILDSASNKSKRQHFFEPTTPAKLNAARSRILALGMRSGMGYAPGLVSGFGFGAMHGGQDGGAETPGSNKLKKELASLISLLNARGKELSHATIDDFSRKLRDLEIAEKEISEFVDRFRDYTRNDKAMADDSKTILSDDDMKAAMATYAAAAKTAVKKTLTIESALGAIKLRVDSREFDAFTTPATAAATAPDTFHL